MRAPRFAISVIKSCLAPTAFKPWICDGGLGRRATIGDQQWRTILTHSIRNRTFAAGRSGGGGSRDRWNLEARFL